MKLSEAIRLGAMMKPQGFEVLIADGRSCAIGAAADAIGANVDDSSGSMSAVPPKLRTAFPLLSVCADSPCPSKDCGVIRCGVSSVIIHLNDTHRWTREEIADWVESREALAAPVADNAVAKGRNEVCESDTREKVSA